MNDQQAQQCSCGWSLTDVKNKFLTVNDGTFSQPCDACEGRGFMYVCNVRVPCTWCSQALKNLSF